MLLAQLGGGCASTSTTTPTTAVSTATAEAVNQMGTAAAPAVPTAPPFKVVMEQFADLRILRYQVPGFEAAGAPQKELLYYLYEAALSGRDIMYDQNYKHNLRVRRTLEAVWQANQDRRTASTNQGQIDRTPRSLPRVRQARVVFSNGIHHHYSTRKFVPECSPAYFKELIFATDSKHAAAGTQGRVGDQVSGHS